MGRGRPINYDRKTVNGMAVIGAAKVQRHLDAIGEFITQPSDPKRGELLNMILGVGAQYARAQIEPGEDVKVKAGRITGKNAAGDKTSTGSGVVYATGDDVLFWEFGTGLLLAPGSHPKAMEFDVRPGSFSETHAGWLTGEKLKQFHGQWPYAGSWTKGQYPKKAMWNAAKVMRDALPRIVAQIHIFEQ